jgi:hypothetical protein
MKYDFVEIGTSNFDTLIESATDQTRGISIEPIQYYLDALPKPPGVLKLKCAVSANNQRETLQVYYVPEDLVRQHNLPDWLRGCNSVGNYHLQHHVLGVTHLVQQDQVVCLPIGTVFDQYEITELDYLKIDTEGSDCAIMLHLFDYLQDQDSSVRPRRILFESNELAVPAQVQLVISKFQTLGYSLVRSDYDTVLEISST